MNSIDFNKLIFQLLPAFLRKNSLLDFFNSVLAPLKQLHAASSAPGLTFSFKAFREEMNYKLRFNAQIKYLEHFLNDKYDSQAREIYIDNTADQIEYTYLRNRIETSSSKMHLYSTWKSTEGYTANDFALRENRRYTVAITHNATTTPPSSTNANWSYYLDYSAGTNYVLGTIVIYSGSLWLCVVDNTFGLIPSLNPGNWVAYEQLTYLENIDEIGTETDYIIRIPFSQTTQDEEEMRAAVNYYNLAGKRYEIEEI